MNTYGYSIITNTDSYKVSMPFQYPEHTETVYSYIESRGGMYKETMMFGDQIFRNTYLDKPITKEDIDFAEKFWTAHGEPFYREGWEYILNTYNGYLPICIRAVPEGTVVPTNNVVAVIYNTDPECWWLTTWLETAYLRAIWYGSTVATRSFQIKKILKDYLEKSGDVSGLAFKLHDFGARGVSSLESANIAGAAHLVNFMGTDTATAIIGINNAYPTEKFEMYGFSIPATEHSTITSWGRDNEVKAYKNVTKLFGSKYPIYACVSDSYDIFKAAEMWCEMAEEIKASGSILVVRPDSGDPVEVLPRLVKTLAKGFGYTKNDKGYKVLNGVRIIWGDGINEVTISSILRVMVDVMAFSADNFAFGCGGYLLQSVNRDTQKFAMKCSAAMIEGEWVDVFKDPITDSGKTSKKGTVTLYRNEKGFYTGVSQVNDDELVTTYRDGVHTNTSFDFVCRNAARYC